MSTQLIRSLSILKPSHRGGVMTIGNFDGVHLGHQALIGAVLRQAKQLNCPSSLLTFEPHPVEYFKRAGAGLPRLSNFLDKWILLSQSGLDNVILLKFNQTIASMSASDFVRKIHHDLQPRVIIIGDDFRFGHKRLGDVALLREMGSELGFTVEALPSLLQDGIRISSTRIREALMAGDFPLAKRLLGHDYFMSGRVGGGDRIGRQLGFPTANIALNRRTSLIAGIFTVRVLGLAKEPLPGVASIGTRPTVNGTKALLEVHLLDFNQNIYGRRVRVSFCKKLRDEVRFANLELLKAQIAEDVAEARRYFKDHHDRA